MLVECSISLMGNTVEMAGGVTYVTAFVCSKETERIDNKISKSGCVSLV